MRALSNTPDLILSNGRIYTVDDAQPWAEAIAVRKHRIVAVGDNAAVLALAGPETQTIDLQGKLVLPGLCDAHIHFLSYGMGLRTVGLADTTSRAEMLERIRVFAAGVPAGEWVTGWGWNESRWGETDFPTAAELDAVTGDHPAIFQRSDGHGAVANSAALKLASVTASTPNPPGGVIDRLPDGSPAGFLRELAIDLVERLVPPPTPAQVDAALLGAQAQMHKLGITAVHTQRIKDNPDGQWEWPGLLRLRANGQLKLRVTCNIAAHDLPHAVALGLRSGFGDDTLRIGFIKVFTDGSLGSRTAWLLAAFEKLSPDEADSTGVNVTPPEQMAAEFRTAVEHGFAVSVHAIGDQANRTVIDIFEELQDAGLEPPIPHRIEHVQIIDPADVRRLGPLRLTASVQPLHATDDQDTADLFLGARGAHMYNFKTLADSGALLAFGSDAPVADPNPFLGFQAAILRKRPERMDQPAWYPAECVTLEQTIYAYTLGAAQAAGWQKVTGSLEPGKRADLVVVDRDLFALVEKGVTGRELAETEVVMTLFGGEIVYRR